MRLFTPRMIISALTAITTAVMLESCAHQAAAPPTNSTVAALVKEVEITGDSEGARAGCTTETVTTRLVSLYEAINRADPNVTSAYFSSSTFVWYCGELHTSYNIDELDTYLQQRFDQHEQLRLISIEYTGWDDERGLLHFGPYTVERSADDLGSEPKLVIGKGAYHCESQTFVVLCAGG